MAKDTDYSKYQFTDDKFLKKIYNILGEENFSRMVDICNEYCVAEEYQKKMCDRNCSKCYLNFIKSESGE